MRKIGFYGGSFDPIHWGHVHMAIELKEKEKLDEVWLSPAYQSPLKRENGPHASSEDRLELVRLAIEGIPGLKVFDREAKDPQLSYTVDTLRYLTQSYPDVQWYLILGDDCIPGFPYWKEPEEIVKLATLLIAKRSPNPIVCPTDKMSLADAIRSGLRKTNLIEISSTYVRQRLANGLFCEHLIPLKALQYLYKHTLYSANPPHLKGHAKYPKSI